MPMNNIIPYSIEAEIVVMIEKAVDFGQDIAQSYVRLAEKLGHKVSDKRDCYGLVLKVNDTMAYYGGFTQAIQNEAIDKSIETHIIPAGNYQSILIEDWNKKLLEIGPTFDQILKSGLVDMMSPCIEYYKSETELICMVKGK
jgi:effector-binding domain-containing protein